LVASAGEKSDFDDMFSRFDTIPDGDRQIYGRTDGHAATAWNRVAEF